MSMAACLVVSLFDPTAMASFFFAKNARDVSPCSDHQGLTEKMDKHGRNSQGRTHTHTHTVTEVFNFGPERSRHPSLGIFWFVSWTFLIYIYQYLLCPFDVFIWVALDSLEQCICQIICASPAHRCLFSVPCSTSLSAVEPVVLKQ